MIKNKNWRDTITEEEKKNITYGRWDRVFEDFIPSEELPVGWMDLHVLDIKEYDEILYDKYYTIATPYDYFEGNLDEVSKNKNRNERLSPELNVSDIPMIDNKFMLIQNNTYRVYFDLVVALDERYSNENKLMTFDIVPTAKALNYGFIIQSSISICSKYNPVLPFFDNVLGYNISTNLYTPVTVNIPKNTFLARCKPKLYI